MTNDELLADYAKEIGVEMITLSMLIESHRTLRNWNISTLQTDRGLAADAYRKLMEQRKTDKLFSVDDLREMTLQDLVALFTINLAEG